MSQYSDLVHDSRLSTRFVAGNTIHTYLESTTVLNRRARRQKRVETWVRSKELGRGSFGIVWLERCPRDNNLRAVKEIAKKKIRKNAYHRELEAMIKFSHHRVCRCLHSEDLKLIAFSMTACLFNHLVGMTTRTRCSLPWSILYLGICRNTSSRRCQKMRLLGW